MDMEQFNPSAEEFANVMQQMYPDQSQRVISELRAAKMQQYIMQQQEEAEPKPPAKKATKRTRTATTGKKG